MDPRNPNYPPGLSPQLDPTITPQAAPGAPPPPGLFSTASAGFLGGQHDARLQSHDIAAGYAAAGITGAAEVSMRAAQLFGMHAEVAEAAQRGALNAADAARGTSAAAGHLRRARTFGRIRSIAAPMDPFALGRGVYRAAIGVGGAALRIPGAAAGVATFGLTLAAQEAAIASVGNIYQGHANRMQSATLVNQTAGVSGVAFSQQEARGSQMGQMASGMGMDFEEFSGLTNMLSQGGAFQGVSNLQEFKSKLRTSLQQLKQIAEVTNSTLQEAGQVSLMLKQQGFGGAQLPAAAAQAFGMGQATGLGAGAFLQMGGVGSQFGATTNIGMSRGSSMFQQALGDVEHSIQRGSISPEMLQRMGGTSSSATLALMQGTMGQAGMLGTTVSQMMGFIAKSGEGEYATPVIDQEKLEKLLNGGVSRQQLAAVSQSQQVLGMHTAIQRAAMPQINQMLHATLSAGTSSPEEYLRKAELMNISPDVAKLIMETERNRPLTDAATQIAVGNNMAQQSIARSQNSGTFMGRLAGNIFGSGSDMGFGIRAAQEGLGDAVSRTVFNASNAMFGGESVVQGPTAAGRELMVMAGGSADIRSRLAGGGSIDTLRQTETIPAAGRNPSMVAGLAFGGAAGMLAGALRSTGAAEDLREARFREFETLFANAPSVGFGAAESTDSVFGESRLGLRRSAVPRELLARMASTRRNFQPNESQLARAQNMARERITQTELFREAGVGFFGNFFGRRKREELQTLGFAKRAGLGDTQVVDNLINKIRRGDELSGDEVEAYTEIRMQTLRTAELADFDASGLGSDVTALSGFGQLSGAALQRSIEEGAKAIGDPGDSARTGAIRGAAFGAATGLVRGGILGSLQGAATGAFGGAVTGDFFNRRGNALTEALTGGGAAANIMKIDKIRRTVEAGGDLEQALADSGFEGDLLRGVRDYADRGFTGLDDQIAKMSMREYQQTIDTIAQGVGEKISLMNLDPRASGFEGDLSFFGSKFGVAGAAMDDRTAAMTEFMRASLRNDGTLADEADELRRRNLSDQAALFDTVEMLHGGDEAKIRAAGFDPSEFQGMSRKHIIAKLGQKNLLSGVAGAQAQASSEQTLEGRSLAGDLLAFSKRVEDLAAVVGNLQDRAGLAPTDVPSPESPDAPPMGQSQLER